jgi:hypothetical protein
MAKKQTSRKGKSLGLRNVDIKGIEHELWIQEQNDLGKNTSSKTPDVLIRIQWKIARARQL